MATLSTCIIVKNEIKNLPGLVSDLRQFSEEIIIVDTGSTDGTLEWLEANKDNVLKLDHFTWIDHFGEARNYSFSKATKDWIFWCDADDRISPELIEEIKNIKVGLNSTQYTSVFINYLFGPGFDVPRRRMLRRSSNPKWFGACHEFVMPENDINTKIRDDAKILHQRKHVHTTRNLGIFIKNILKGHELTSRDMTYYSNELRDAGFAMKAADVAEAAMFINDMWKVDVWTLMVFNAAPKWLMNKEYASRGILFINDYEKIGGIRSDVLWLRGSLNKIVGNDEDALKDWRLALKGDPNLKDLELYACLPIYSIILPAINIYVNTVDIKEKQHCIDILANYKDEEVVTQFFKEYDIK